MSLLLLLTALTFIGGPTEDDEVGRAEVIRRGDTVEHVTHDIEDADPIVIAISQITAEVPKVDNDKFHLSVISKEDGTCPACIALHKEWDRDRTLRAYAIPDSPKDSWAHFTWYDYNDKLQQWRWTPTAQNPNPIKINRFPTIILQPPLSGAWGNPQTVIFKYTYEGDPNAFSKSLNRALKEYVATYQNKQGVRHHRDFTAPPKTETASKGFGQKVRAPDAFTAAPVWTPNPPPREAIGDVDRVGSEDAPVIDDAPMGDQEVPPLVIPNDVPNEEEAEPDPVRPLDFLRKPSIIVIRDRDQRDKNGVEDHIDTLVANLQAKYGGGLVEKQLDVSKYGKLYGVLPDEVPAVLVVQGKKVREKLLPNLDFEKPRGSVLLVYMLLSMVLGAGAKVVLLSKIIHWVFVAIIVVSLFVAVLFFCLMGTLVFRPRVAPAPAPALTPAQVAEIVKASTAAAPKT